MRLAALTSLSLLPFASAGVHKLKLQKLPASNSNPALESAYLSEKYGAEAQLPMMGAGGHGRQLRVAKPSFNGEGEELLWTQDAMTKGGHGVPLSSKPSCHRTLSSRDLTMGIQTS